MPTAARQKYLAKQVAKQADRFTDADRQGEYDKVFSQLGQISDPEVDKFEALMSEWVKDGRVRQGVIPVPRIRRAIVYSLGISRSKTFVSLRSDNPDDYAEDATQPANEASANATPAETQNDGAGGNVEDEEQPPELVPSTTEPQARTPEQSTNLPTEQQTEQPITIMDEQYRTSKKDKKKKQQTFAQPAPRGSRHASRPPSMKPKAQSA